MTTPSKERTAVIRIDGMTCASCELLLERRLKAVPGVIDATVDHRKGTATLRAFADALPEMASVSEAVQKAGYCLANEPTLHHDDKHEPHQGTLILGVDGLHTAHDERRLREALRPVPGIKHSTAHMANGTVKIHYSSKPDLDQIKAAAAAEGYELRSLEEATEIPQDKRKWMEIGGALVIILAIIQILRTFDLVSLAPSTTDALTLGGVLLIGLVAGASSCLAVTGGLLIAMAAKYHEAHRSDTPLQQMKPLLAFNAGRVASYFVLGGVVGFLGQSISLSAQWTGIMNIVIALVMLSLALKILGIVPKGFIPLRPPKALSHRIADLAESRHPGAPFALGALTFFLPCGFTQSLQLAALASGSFMSGALMMGVFSLGTLPALLGISVISSTAKGSASRLFLRFSGVLVLLLALFNFRSGLALTGIDLSQAFSGNGGGGGTVEAPQVQNGVQEIAMAVSPYSYEPASLTVKAGVPVRWKIDASRASGCTSSIVVPSLRISRILKKGENIIEFTPPKTGTIAFSCGMGMVRGSFTVI